MTCRRACRSRGGPGTDSSRCATAFSRGLICAARIPPQAAQSIVSRAGDGFEAAEETVGLVVDSGAEVELAGGAAAAAVPRDQRPESIDLDRLAVMRSLLV